MRILRTALGTFGREVGLDAVSSVIGRRAIAHTACRLDERSSNADAFPTTKADEKFEEGGRGEGTTSKNEETYMDLLFKEKDSFERDEDLQRRPMRKTVVGQSVFATQAYERAQRELNKEWDLPPSGSSGGIHRDTQRERTRASSSSLSPRQERSASPTMTKSEIAVFENVFRDIMTHDLLTSSGHAYDEEKERLFGSSMDKANDQSLRLFWSKTNRQREQMRRHESGPGHSAVARANRPGYENVFAMIRERIAAEGIGKEKLEEGIDLAREQLKSCQSQDDAWQWALQNVWPASTATTTTERQVERPFGMHTPFYAPVLHLLFRELRDRFRAPYTALAVLRTARHLGPESSVLGCTPHLYAEAIQTCWNVLRDVQSAHDLVLEAKESGILSGAFSANVLRSMMQDRHTSLPDELADLQDDQRINRIVDHIKQQVESFVLRAQTSIVNHDDDQVSSLDGQSDAGSQLLERQRDLVNDMCNAITAGSRARFASSRKGGGESRSARTARSKGRSSFSNRLFDRHQRSHSASSFEPSSRSTLNTRPSSDQHLKFE